MRLIDADAMIESIKMQSNIVRLLGSGELTSMANVIEEGFLQEIENAPTIEAVPMRRGEWIRHENHRYSYDREQGDINAGVYYTCSECDYISSTHNFCPNCGADMRGDAK